MGGGGDSLKIGVVVNLTYISKAYVIKTLVETFPHFLTGIQPKMREVTGFVKHTKLGQFE